MKRRLLTVCAALAACSLPLVAQQTLDRSKVPPPGKPPALHVPAWTKTTLTDGAELMVSEKHDLPLVSFSITFLGGADQFEPADRRGVASLTAAMLSEGTKTRDGEALSNALQLLGTSVQTSIAGESGTMSFVSTSGKFAATLDILADMLLHPAFPTEGLERLRAQRLVQLDQAKVQSGSIAARVFPRILYGGAHPYGQATTEESIKAINRDNVGSFYQSYFRPGHALITVVGDVKTAEVKPLVERALGAWTAGGDKPSFAYPPVPDRRPTTIYLVDKPGAAQSTFSLGLPGPARNTADYFALQVMNVILGGQFQSRLNANIREDKGYSYGVSSSFAYGKGPGPFRAGGDIVTAKSDVALIEFMKELRGIRGTRPVTDEELTTAKDALIQRLPGTFESVSRINGSITSIWSQALPEDYYQQYSAHVAAVTKEEVLRVANQYIDLEHLAIVIVGDRATIEAPLKATGIAPIAITSIEGSVG